MANVGLTPFAPLGGMIPGAGLQTPAVGLGLGLAGLGFVPPVTPEPTPVDPNEKALDDMEYLILSQLNAYVNPTDPLLPAPELKKRQPIILAKLQQTIQQGIAPPANTIELLNQLQQLYTLRETLKTTWRQVATPTPVIPQTESTLPETKFSEGPAAQPARGRARGGNAPRGRAATTTGRGAARAETPTGGEGISAAPAAANSQVRLGLFPMFPTTTAPDTFVAPAQPAKITSLLSDQNLRNILKGIQTPEPGLSGAGAEIDILDTVALARYDPNCALH